MKIIKKAFLFYKNLDVIFLLLLGVVGTFAIEKVNAPLIVILFLAQIIVLLKQKRVDFNTNTYFYCLIALFILSLLGLLYTENTPRGFDMLGRQISFLLFPMFYSVYRIKNINLVFRVYCIVIFLLVFLLELNTVYRFLFQSDTFPLSLDLFLSYRFTGAEITKLLGIHNAYFGIYIVFANVLILNHLQRVNSLRFFVLFFLIICLQSFFLLQMIAKTAIIMNTCIVVCSVIYIFIKQKKIKFLLLSGVLLACIAFFSFSYLKLPLNRISERFVELKQGQNTERETRVKLWNAAMPIIKQNIVIGVGLGDVQDQLHVAYQNNGIESKSNVHNQYLDYLMRYGSVGLFLFLFVLGYALVYSCKTANYIYFCFTLIIIGGCFTENLFSRQWGITFYACFNYLLYLNAQKE